MKSLRWNRKPLASQRSYKIDFEGVATFLQNTFEANESKSLRRWAKEYMDKIPCPKCEGSRLRKESLFFKVNGKNIAELAHMDVVELAEWFRRPGRSPERDPTEDRFRNNKRGS